MKIFYWLFVFLGSAVLLSKSVIGHHAYNANYTDERGSIEGVVVEVFWGNPHVHYYLQVTNNDGSQSLWNLESENLGMMTRAGWTIDTLQVGNRIRVFGSLGREGRPRLAMELNSVEFLD
ncbi:MAG: hypothetical protein CMM56_07430 [Rhodospirillaceae bacterium]|nr:hypothetical protein [Rhodospirillaceae bacterium]|tara:strand:- start:134 stop:493 length:360 start_codon:yes stop_codon:yes gene_type:complete